MAAATGSTTYGQLMGRHAGQSQQQKAMGGAVLPYMLCTGRTKV